MKNMLATQVLQNSINNLKTITKVDLSIMDNNGNLIAATTENAAFPIEQIKQFSDSNAASQAINGQYYMKVYDETEAVYILSCQDLKEHHMIGKIAVYQLEGLITAYKERTDKNNFFQNLILDNLLLVDIYNRAKKLHIETSQKRVVLLIEAYAQKDTGAMEMLRNMFSVQSGDFVTAVDEHNLIIIKQLDIHESFDDINEMAEMVIDMMNTELMINARISYGTIINELKDVSKSYKEAKMALDMGKIFYAQKKVVAYNTLGIGRLIYQLPVNLCQMFIHEIFGNEIPEELDEETLNTIQMFLENNLNVSETARQLYVHRNTLLYRLEKLQKATNLAIRIFNDALTLQIALVVAIYRQYREDLDF